MKKDDNWTTQINDYRNNMIYVYGICPKTGLIVNTARIDLIDISPLDKKK